jgi:Tol biopolymer transport system component
MFEKLAAYGRIFLPGLLVAGSALALANSTTQKVEIFAPGAIPTTSTSNASPAFAPDGDSVYLTQSMGDSSAIMVSQRSNGQWSKPQVAAFSGKYTDLESSFSPDGKYLIFASNRPAESGGSLADGNYDGEVRTGKGGHLWKVARTKKGWGQPQLLPSTINSNSSVFSPSIAGDGSLYFMRAENGGRFHLYRSQLKHGEYQPPVRVSFSDDDKIGDFDPAVARDESYIVFSSPRSPAPAKTSDLFIVFRTKDGWGQPIDLRSSLSDDVHGIEARLSPDGKTLYFTNGRTVSGDSSTAAKTYGIWQVSLDGVLESKGTAEEPSNPAQ